MANLVGVPNFKIVVNGNELPVEYRAAIEGVSFEDELNLPSMFVIKLNVVDFEKGNWRGIDLKTFKPGDVVEVHLGIDSMSRMLTGEITSLELTLQEQAFAEIRGYDRLHRLRFGKESCSFKNMKDSDLASAIATKVGLTAQTDDTGTVHQYLFQNNQSNYEFLVERALRNNYEILVDDKQLLFRKPQLGSAPVLALQYKIDLDSFSARMRTMTENELTIRGWSVKDKNLITATATSGSETTIMSGKQSGYQLAQQAFGKAEATIINEEVVDATEASNIAKAKYNLMLKEFITGEGQCSGNPMIIAGKTIEIKGIGDRFSGVYYVVATVHSINRSRGYTTTFKVRRTGI